MDTFVGVEIYRRFSQVHVQSQEGNPLAEGRLEHDDPIRFSHNNWHKNREGVTSAPTLPPRWRRAPQPQSRAATQTPFDRASRAQVRTKGENDGDAGDIGRQGSSASGTSSRPWRDLSLLSWRSSG